MSGRDIVSAVLELNGKKKIEDKNTTEEFSSKTCVRCEKDNPPTGKFCLRCGAALDVESMIDIEEKRKETEGAMTVLLNDPEVFNLLLSKMKEKNLQPYLSVK
jgi:predicted amidophosphoribosyltransferase